MAEERKPRRPVVRGHRLEFRERGKRDGRFGERHVRVELLRGERDSLEFPEGLSAVETEGGERIARREAEEFSPLERHAVDEILDGDERTLAHQPFRHGFPDPLHETETEAEGSVFERAIPL